MIQIKFHPMSTWPGAENGKPTRSRFRAGPEKTRLLLVAELSAINARNLVIEAYFEESQLRIDGYPRAHERPRKPGVVVDFSRDGEHFRMPCDAYNAFDDNVRAIALTLQALRAVERYGATQRREQYAGWKALPAPGEPLDAAFETLASIAETSTNAVRMDSESAYRVAARKCHPDFLTAYDRARCAALAPVDDCQRLQGAIETIRAAGA